MASPEFAIARAPELPKRKELVEKINYDFDRLTFEHELERRQQGLDTAPQKIDGAEINRALIGTNFEIYSVNIGKREDKNPKVRVGIKFTGEPEVTWASFLQGIVLEAQSVEEVLDWLRIEAVIRADKSESSKDTERRWAEERNINEVLKASKEKTG